MEVQCLLTILERKEIYLTQYGNVGCKDSCVSKDEYFDLKGSNECLDVAKVGIVRTLANKYCPRAASYDEGTSAHSLRTFLQTCYGNDYAVADNYLTIGDVIAGVALAGIPYRFSKDDLGCQFLCRES